MEGLVLLSKMVGAEKRPLSWVIGEQGVIKPAQVSMKEEKREERAARTQFRPINEI